MFPLLLFVALFSAIPIPRFLRIRFLHIFGAGTGGFVIGLATHPKIPKIRGSGFQLARTSIIVSYVYRRKHLYFLPRSVDFVNYSSRTQAVKMRCGSDTCYYDFLKRMFRNQGRLVIAFLRVLVADFWASRAGYSLLGLLSWRQYADFLRAAGRFRPAVSTRLNPPIT